MSAEQFRAIQTAYLNCVTRHGEAMHARQNLLRELPQRREEMKLLEQSLNRLKSVELINEAPDGKNAETREAQLTQHLAGHVGYNVAQTEIWAKRRIIEECEGNIIHMDAVIRFEQTRIEYLTEALRFLSNPAQEQKEWQPPEQPAKHPVRRPSAAR